MIWLVARPLTEFLECTCADFVTNLSWAASLIEHWTQAFHEFLVAVGLVEGNKDIALRIPFSVRSIAAISARSSES